IDAHELSFQKGPPGGALAVGEEAVMADAVKAIRQGMQKETPDELFGFERHPSGPAAMAIVTPAERHLAILHTDQAGIGEWRRDGYSGSDRLAPVSARRRAAWHKRPNRGGLPWSGGERRPAGRRVWRYHRKTVVVR